MLTAVAPAFIQNSNHLKSSFIPANAFLSSSYQNILSDLVRLAARSLYFKHFADLPKITFSGDLPGLESI